MRKLLVLEESAESAADLRRIEDRRKTSARAIAENNCSLGEAIVSAARR
jgi:hypothetical protein